MSRGYENEYVSLDIGEDGILRATYKKGRHITLEVAKMLVKERLEFQGDNEYPSLLYLQDLGKVDNDARDYLALPHATKGATAIAIITASPFMNMISNMYIYFSRPRVPTRMFRNEEAALGWLKKYKEHRLPVV